VVAAVAVGLEQLLSVKEVMADQVVVMLVDLLTLLQLVIQIQIQIIQKFKDMLVGSVDPTFQLVVEEDSSEQELAVIVMILNLDQVVLA
tara:strand:+ start:41 stop:307 length:267 start_codon:yes stop_codon:yes gene_type:complete